MGERIMALMDVVSMPVLCLDHELAASCSPNGSGLRALRARQLADPSTRHELASALRRIVADAEHPCAARRSVPPCRAAVLSWREGVLALAERLERPGNVNPCGVARVLVMLGDRSGPLYRPERERLLGELVCWVTEGLRPCPPHRWACPVIMELDPGHAAWTCGRCGAIAITDDPAVRPA